MKFLAPAAFWFAATIPVVVLFYLLKRKRVVKLVSSTLLWQKFLAETQANAPFQKLRHNWLLLLQLLLLLLAIFALSRPYFAGDSKSSALRVVILDASASMQCTDEAPSRFDKARSEALKWVDGLRDQDQMLVLQAAGNTEVKQSATSNKTALRRALQACAVTDSPTHLKEALKLAETLTRDQPLAEIHLFSDGAVGDLTEFENKGLNVIYHRVGERSDNLGIIALDVRSNPEDATQRAIYASVQNFSTNAHEAELELRFEDRVLEVRLLKFAAGETVPQVFFASQATNGVFTVNLKTKDDLAADNQASMFSQLPQPVKVLLVSRGNRFLEKALRSTANVELSMAQDSTDPAAAFDLVVLDDISPAVWPAGNILGIHIANTNWFDGFAKIENPAVVDWKSTHPLLRYVNFDNVQISEALAVKTPTWALSMVDAQQTPLVLAGELARQKIVWIGFDPLQSTWPLRISFPIFIANAVEFLNPASARNGQLFVRAGDPFRFALVQSAATAELTAPGGSKMTLPVDAGAREIVFGDTVKQGTYRLRVGTNETTFCVNLLDAAESNIKPRAELQFGKYSKVEATTLKRANMELWRWIAAGALAVLMFEWWYYHRRTA
ncbi:MAG: BatA and WFA domain-containing protein [Verrucomicrobiota bacterium]